MSLNETPTAERLHIGFFGMRNAGKSSVVNAVTGQALSIVSDIKGTTTDPVTKSMELLPLGPVVIIDTPGLDDEGELGKMRVEKAKNILAKTDIAVLVVDSAKGLSEQDNDLIAVFKEKKLPYIVAYNKSDLVSSEKTAAENEIFISALSNRNIDELKNMIGRLSARTKNEKRIVADILDPDEQTIRDILDEHCAAVVCRETELKKTLEMLKVKPKLVITDSQAFGKVSKDTPADIMLTSFSILFARYKGDLSKLVRGAKQLSRLKNGDKVLISEGCTHHRQCNDIGTVKMPGWIENFSGVKPEFVFTSGGEFPEDLSDFSVIVHCGGCMLNEKEMNFRIEKAVRANVPIVNYGIAIAHMHGILKRSLEPFPSILKELEP